MADDEGGGGSNLPWLIIGGAFLAAFFFIVMYKVDKPFDPTYLNIEYFFGKIFQFFQVLYNFFVYGSVGLLLKVIVSAICIFLIGLSSYLLIRLFEMEGEHEEHVYPHEEHESGPVITPKGVIRIPDVSDDKNFAAATGVSSFENVSQVPSEKPGQLRWETVLDHISSQNASDWRLAINEADIILDEMIEGQGYPGGTLGERLKNAGTGAFRTYQDAWEAHTVRNKIAHEGSQFELNYREAKQTIDRYENVFREFEYI